MVWLPWRIPVPHKPRAGGHADRDGGQQRDRPIQWSGLHADGQFTQRKHRRLHGGLRWRRGLFQSGQPRSRHPSDGQPALAEHLDAGPGADTFQGERHGGDTGHGDADPTGLHLGRGRRGSLPPAGERVGRARPDGRILRGSRRGGSCRPRHSCRVTAGFLLLADSGFQPDLQQGHAGRNGQYRNKLQTCRSWSR